MRFLPSVLLALVLLAVAPGAGADPIFSARLLGNVADQTIVGFPSSAVTWDIERVAVSLRT